MGGDSKQEGLAHAAQDRHCDPRQPAIGNTSLPRPMPLVRYPGSLFWLVVLARCSGSLFWLVVLARCSASPSWFAVLLRELWCDIPAVTDIYQWMSDGVTTLLPIRHLCVDLHVRLSAAAHACGE